LSFSGDTTTRKVFQMLLLSALRCLTKSTYSDFLQNGNLVWLNHSFKFSRLTRSRHHS
jgi:hypothetical protein